MKKIIEKHPEFIKLAEFFKKMEAMAETLEIDEYVLGQEFENKRSIKYHPINKNTLSIAHKREDILVDGPSDKESSLIRFPISFEIEQTD